MSQNDLTNYLKKHQDHKNEINIVGPLAKSFHIKDDPIIYVDGGAQFKNDLVGISIGDGDSFAGELDIRLSQDKNYSDLAYVLNNIPPTYQKINLIGFLGERRDHELINLAEVQSFLSKRSAKTEVIFDSEVFAYSRGDWRVLINSTFTLFSFEMNKIKLNGKCKYPLDDNLKPLSSHGLSNVGSGEISLRIDSPIFIFI